MTDRDESWYGSIVYSASPRASSLRTIEETVTSSCNSPIACCSSWGLSSKSKERTPNHLVFISLVVSLLQRTLSPHLATVQELAVHPEVSLPSPMKGPRRSKPPRLHQLGCVPSPEGAVTSSCNSPRASAWTIYP